VLKALKMAGRKDLIGDSPRCLVSDIPVSNHQRSSGGKSSKTSVNEKNKNMRSKGKFSERGGGERWQKGKQKPKRKQ